METAVVDDLSKAQLEVFSQLCVILYHIPFSNSISTFTTHNKVFEQLIQSRQSGARVAFTKVQTRHQDLREIEATLAQVAQMMQDVTALVLELDVIMANVENNAVAAGGDMESGYEPSSAPLVTNRLR